MLYSVTSHSETLAHVLLLSNSSGGELISYLLSYSQMHAESKMWDERLVEPEEVFASACKSPASFADAEESLWIISSPALLGEI